MKFILLQSEISPESVTWVCAKRIATIRDTNKGVAIVRLKDDPFAWVFGGSAAKLISAIGGEFVQ